MPSRIKAFSVGVRPRWRKSARKPSKEMSIVVGRNVVVPFDSAERAIGFRVASVARYAAYRRIRNKAMIERWMIAWVKRRLLRAFRVH